MGEEGNSREMGLHLQAERVKAFTRHTCHAIKLKTDMVLEQEKNVAALEAYVKEFEAHISAAQPNSGVAIDQKSKMAEQ
jgi:hypothetical protein